MSIAQPRRGTLQRAQKDAHSLVEMGIPIFTCSLSENGDPRPPKGYQLIRPSHDRVDRWRPGLAMCAVTGIVFDVIDVDPRNGGQLSLKRLAKTLGDNGPEIYWEVRTASGGTHLYIEALGIGTHPGFLPGIDLKGGKPDGTSRGFVFLPPTVRPSKAEGNTGVLVNYEARSELSPLGEDGCVDAIREFILNPPDKEGSGIQAPREQISILKQECLEAVAGNQRRALLRYTHELERKGYDRNDILILLASLVQEMPTFDKRRPWRAEHLRGLLHKPGEVVGDAQPDEDLAITPTVRRGGLQAYSTVVREKTRWQWSRWIAEGDATLIDGDAGLGKSLVTIDIAARLSSGRPMPGEAESFMDPVPVLLLAPEDRASVTAGRLEAARAEPSMVFRPSLGTVEIERKDRSGKHAEKRATFDGSLLYFPDHVLKFRNWIKEYGIKLVVIDPISAFLSEKTNSNNDASVRRALEPLSQVLGEYGCSAIMIRHLNKNSTQDAKYRGGGSVAFGAVSRVQVMAGEMPDGSGRFALAQVKNNHLARRPDEALTYEITDSEIIADEDGNLVPCILWGDYANVSLRALTGVNKRGPKPERRHEVLQVLEDLFSQQDTWPVKDVEAQLRASGVSVNEKTLATAREELGIFSRPTFKRGGGVGEWVWTTEPRKHRRNG